jgi:hypothetical protein
MDRELAIDLENEAIVRAYRRYWLSSSGWFYIYSTVISGLIFVLLMVFRGSELLFIGFFGGVSLTVGIVGYWGYSETIGNVRARMSDPSMRSYSLYLTDGRLSIRTELFSSDIDWKMICGLYRYRDVWMLFEGQFPLLTLPVKPLDEESQRFILSKISENGGKII